MSKVGSPTEFKLSTGAKLVMFPAPPEVEEEIRKRTELSKQPSKTPWSEAEARARMKRAMAKPDLNYLCKSVGDGE